MIYFPPEIWIFVLAAFVIFLAIQGGKSVSKAAKPLPADYGEELEYLPYHLSTSPDAYSYISRAYLNKTTKRYVARIDCYTLDRIRWIEAKTEDELKEQMEQLFQRNKEECQTLEN